MLDPLLFPWPHSAPLTFFILESPLDGMRSFCPSCATASRSLSWNDHSTFWRADGHCSHELSHRLVGLVDGPNCWEARYVTPNWVSYFTLFRHFDLRRCVFMAWIKPRNIWSLLPKKFTTIKKPETLLICQTLQQGFPTWGYICLSEGVHWRLAIEGKNIFTCWLFSKLYAYITFILFSKVTICLLLNIYVKNHEKIFCHKAF